METRERKRIPVRWVVLIGVPAALIGLFYALSPIRGFANFVTARFSRPVKDGLGTVFGLLPFSVMELEYVAAGVFLLWYIIRTAVLTVRGDRRLAVLGRRALILALIVAYGFTAFLWCFSIDYCSDSFTEKSGLAAGAVEREDLYSVTRYFILNASRWSTQVARDGEGHFAEDMDTYLAGSVHVYDHISEEFEFLAVRSRVPKKMVLFSGLSSWMGFTGVYFPFSGESNINIDAPGCLIPATIAHELAHQRGVYSEQEANFVGIAAAVSSGDPVYVYSGWLQGSMYLSSALYSADPEGWLELSALMSREMRADWVDHSEYWDRFDGKVEEVSSKVYDGYLKAQGQELGIRSYGACVDLLVAYYAQAAGASS